MKLLLDTHIWVWWILDDSRLSVVEKNVLADRNNELLFSVASAWELVIKQTQGLIVIPGNARREIETHLTANDAVMLPIVAEHVWEIQWLPPIHRDPFDRILVAQARCEQATLLSHDRFIREYDVRILP